jgi:hypothetical protein
MSLKSQSCWFVKLIVPEYPFHQTSRMAVHRGTQRITILLEYRSRADIASTWRRALKNGTYGRRNKIIITISWNPFEFHLLKLLTKGRNLQESYNNILISLIQLHQYEIRDNFVFRVGKSRIYITQKNIRLLSRKWSVGFPTNSSFLILWHQTSPKSSISNTVQLG